VSRRRPIRMICAGAQGRHATGRQTKIQRRHPTAGRRSGARDEPQLPPGTPTAPASKLACAGQTLVSARCPACPAGCMRTTVCPPESRRPRSPPAAAAPGEPPPGTWRRGSPWPRRSASCSARLSPGPPPRAPASATRAGAAAKPSQHRAVLQPRRALAQAHAHRVMTAHPVQVAARGQRPPQEGGITIKLVIPGATTGWCAASCAVSM
jgi:hypothetical protein